MESQEKLVVFRSRQHPGATPPALVYARHFAVPFSVALAPVMVAMLLVVLQDRPLNLLLFGGLPAAAIVASFWTTFTLRGMLAEIMIREDQCIPRTVWEVLTRAHGDWRYVIDVRRSNDGTFLTAGDTSHELDDTDWPDSTDLLTALTRARTIYRFHDPSPTDNPDAPTS